MPAASYSFSGSWRGWVVGAVALVAICAMRFVAPIPQDPNYHRFADTRTIARIANFWNVVSNVPFLLVGLYGLSLAARLAPRALPPGYLVFCLAVLSVCFGSAYYHHAPSNPALVWDRLPMSLAFMALFALIVGERVNPAWGRALLVPLLVAGAASVFYWGWTESRGAGDLRPYLLVQFLPIVLIVLILLLYPGSRESAAWLWGSFSMYALAKLAEYFDAPIFRAIGLSGHTLKHLLSAIAVLFALFALLHCARSDPGRRTPEVS